MSRKVHSRLLRVLGPLHSPCLRPFPRPCSMAGGYAGGYPRCTPGLPARRLRAPDEGPAGVVQQSAACPGHPRRQQRERARARSRAPGPAAGGGMGNAAPRAVRRSEGPAPSSVANRAAGGPAAARACPQALAMPRCSVAWDQAAALGGAGSKRRGSRSCPPPGTYGVGGRRGERSSPQTSRCPRGGAWSPRFPRVSQPHLHGAHAGVWPPPRHGTSHPYLNDAPHGVGAPRHRCPAVLTRLPSAPIRTLRRLCRRHHPADR